MSQEIGWSVEAKLLYQIKQLTRALNSRTYIAVFPNLASFPNPGITGTLYVDESTGDIYVWNGTNYVLLSSGITALNGLIAAAQTFATGTAGTDVNISSVGTTHTFNFPTASATNRGLLSSADWTTFNSKIAGTGTVNYVPKFTASGTIGNSQIFDNGTNVGVGTASPSQKLHISSGNVLVQRAYSSGNIPLTILNTSVPSKGQIYDAAVFQSNDVPSVRITEVLGADSSTIGELTLSAGDGNVQVIGSTGSMVLNAGRANGTLGYLIGANHMRILSNGRTVFNGSTDGGYQVDVQGTLRSTQGANFATSSGDVGIGTSSALSRLHVRGSGTSTGSVLTLSNGGEIAAFSDPLGVINFYSDDLSTGASGIKSYIGVYNEFPGNWDGTLGRHRTYMAFATSINSVATERMRIDYLGNVGIGTTSPSEALHVVGRGRFTTIDNNASPTFFLTSDANGVIQKSTYAPTGGSGTTNYVAKFTASGTVGNSQIFDNGTNVGIGTTSPAARLDIRGANAQNIYLITTTAANIDNSIESFFNNGGGWSNLVTRSQTIQFNTSPASGPQVERMRITSAGNVGIGTTSPGQALTVNGTFLNNSDTYLSTSSGNVSIGSTASVAKLYIAGGSLQTTNVRGLSISTQLTTGRLGTYDAGTLSSIHNLFDDESIEIASGSSNTWVSGISLTGRNASINTGTVRLFTSSAERMRLTSAGRLLVGTTTEGTNTVDIAGTLRSTQGAAFATSSGNVTIGTTTITDVNDRLQVEGTVAGGFGTRIINNSTDLSATSRLVLGTQGGNFNIEGMRNNNELRFVRQTSEVMRINGSGNVGIGTTSPAELLHLNRSAAGDVAALVSNTVSSNYFMTRSTGNLDLITTAGAIQFSPNLNERMRLTAAGDVGIGTTSPLDKVDINGSIRFRGNTANFVASQGGVIDFVPTSVFPTTPTVRIYSIGDASNAGWITFGTGTTTGASERMRITSAGDLAIGSTSADPFARNDDRRISMDASGISSTANVALSLNAGASAGRGAQIYFGGGGTRWAELSSNAGESRLIVIANTPLVFSTNNTERMRITAAGNVGIGTASPNQPLQVIGAIDVRDVVGTGGAGVGVEIQSNASQPRISLRTGNQYRVEIFSDVTNAGIRNISNQALQIWTNNTERARFTDVGNLLIGTTTDSGQKLQVNGSSIFGGDVILNGSFVIRNQSFPLYLQTFTTQPIIVLSGGGSERLRITDDGNVGFTQTSFGTSATRTLAMSNGTAPGSSPTDAFQMYSADVVAGNAAPHFRTENGAVVKVYQETTGVGAATFVQGSVNAVYEDSTFDGYTLKQIVKALRNQGLLA